MLRRDRTYRANSESRILKPSLAFITMGNTFASSAGRRGDTTGYELADGGPSALLQAVPELADIESEEFASVASPDLTPALMMQLRSVCQCFWRTTTWTVS